MVQYENSREQCHRAKELRKQASPAERILWNALSALQKVENIRFRRQHPVNPYIADFACVKAGLLIELDGASHETRLDYDCRRDAYLQSKGWTIIRFTNDHVETNLEGVVLTIVNKVRELQAMLPVSAHP